jgi:hypothetical protein
MQRCDRENAALSRACPRHENDGGWGRGVRLSGHRRYTSTMHSDEVVAGVVLFAMRVSVWLAAR